MGRYRTPVFLAEKDVPFKDALFIARMSWIGHGIAALFLISWSVALPVIVADQGLDFTFSSLFDLALTGFSALVIGLVCLVCLLVGFIFFFSFLAALRSTNWTLMATEEGLYLKLRSYVDFTLPINDPIVVFIPRKEIRQIRALDQKSRVVSRAGEFTRTEDDGLEKHHFLELQLYGSDLTQIEHCLQEERKRYAPTFAKGVTSKAKGAAITLHPKGIIKIDWKTKATRLTPSLSTISQSLTRHYPVLRAVAKEQRSIKNLDKEGQEKRLLELAEQGNKIDAVMLARGLYGLSLTEASSFIDDLLE